MIQQLFLVFKTHFDIGFTDLSQTVMEQYAGKMLHEVVETCESTADMDALRYVWTMPAWPLTVMEERCSPADAGKLSALIARGQIVWHALPFTSHYDFCGLEEYMRALHYSRRLCQKHGLPLPLSAKMTDVPGHGAMLPAILAGAGIRFLHLGCNEFAMPPDVPELFFWESPDGSRVLTFYEKSGYGSTLTPPDGWPFPVWLGLMHTQDNCGPQSAALMRGLLRETRAAFPDAQVQCGTLDDFYRALSLCDLSDVPVVRLDLADSWIHGAGSYPREVSQVRQTRRQLLHTEKLAFLLNSPANGAQNIAQAYDALALFGEHTWGLDVKTWMHQPRVYEKEAFRAAKESAPYRYMERSWDEQSARAREAAHWAALARQDVETGTQEVFLNPTGSAFTGWADVPAQSTLPHAAVRRMGVRNMAFVRDLPALSTRAAAQAEIPAAMQPPQEEGILENHRYTLAYDAHTGRISSIFDKKYSRVLLREQDGTGVFSYRYDRFGIEDITEYLRAYAYRYSGWGVLDCGRADYPECPHQTYHPRFSTCELVENTLVFHYMTEESGKLFGDARKVTLSVTLPPLGDEIFVSLQVQDKQETPFIESGTFSLPLGISAPLYRINKNGCVLDPTRDIAPGANHVFYALEAFACAQDRDGGVCVVTQDAPLLSIGETGVYTYRKNYEAHAPQLCFNLFNNMWGTNFPQWMGGDYTYNFTLFGYQGACPTQRALSLCEGVSLLHAPVRDSPLRLPEEVQVSALLPWAQGYILRLRDTAGICRNVQIGGSADLRFSPADLQNQITGEAVCAGMDFEIRPYGIYSFYIESPTHRNLANAFGR